MYEHVYTLYIHATYKYIYIQIRVCTMYIQNYIFINMFVHDATYNYVKT